MGVSPWMNATVGPSEARRAKEGASVDSAEERKGTTGVNPWGFHWIKKLEQSRLPSMPTTRIVARTRSNLGGKERREQR